MDVSTYIAEQIPILQSLHAQLALPADALAEDTARIDAAVRLAIQSVVRSREDEVASWEEKINNGKRAIHSIARAVGDRGRSALAEERRETMVVSVSAVQTWIDEGNLTLSPYLRSTSVWSAKLRSWRR